MQGGGAERDLLAGWVARMVGGAAERRAATLVLLAHGHQSLLLLALAPALALALVLVLVLVLGWG